MASWNEELKEWVVKSRKSRRQIAREANIPTTTFRDYTVGRTTHLDEVSKDKRARLYQLTKIEAFKFEGIENYSAKTLEPKTTPTSRNRDKVDYASVLATLGRIERSLNYVKNQLTESNPEEMKRYDAKSGAQKIESLLERLVLAIEPFRTGSPEDRKILIDYLKQGSSDTFNYIDKMIKVFEQGEAGAEAWLKQMAPPQVLRRLIK